MFKTFMGIGVLALTIAIVQAADENDRFTTLPGFDGEMQTNSYSGYLNVSDGSEKRLHYVFVESQRDPANDPVVIWFNGGPGCSSLLGLFQENGPYVVDEELDPTHQKNEHSWNQQANMLYIEQPAGVGFSTWTTAEGASRETNDTISSADALSAVLFWYSAGFPEYKTNDLYISGESYGGIYVPYLAWRIHEHNINLANQTDKINLKGFLVGNGATNWDFDVSPSFPDTVYGFNIIPKHLYDFMKDNNCVYYFNDFRPHSGPDGCDEVWEKITNLTKDLNWYDLYRVDSTPLTLKGEDRYKTVMIGGQEKRYKRGRTVGEYTPWLKHLTDNDKVSNDILSDYMNSNETRQALHIGDEVQAWEECASDETKFKYLINETASMWIYPLMKEAGIRMVFYSGDTDGAVPTYGTKRWIKELNWPVTEEWRPWITATQVTGYIERYEGLDFVTVKGVGHMAPQWAKPAVTQFFNRWIAGEAV